MRFGNSDLLAVMPGGNGFRRAGACRWLQQSALQIQTAECTISGDSIAFSVVTVRQINTNGLGNSLTYVGGDSDTITEVWGIG